jgi:heavy metal-binding protein
VKRRTFIFGCVAAGSLAGQQIQPGAEGGAPASIAAEAPVEFICPMDPGVRSGKPGRCPRCGMVLVPGIPEIAEYPVSLEMRPPAPRAGRRVQLTFTVRHPKTGARITDFELVHEKLYHLFIVSQDLQFFLHDHPRLSHGGVFRFDAVFPKPGMYRLLSDFYPRHGTPQLVASTVIVPGGPITAGTTLIPDTTSPIATRESANMHVSLTMEPPQPIAGMKTLMFFRLDPAAGLERYLGAWGHMLAASEDLIDMIHNHPFLADGGPQVQFNMIFPRPVAYRVWVQFQRQKVLNTAWFDIAVTELK